MKICLSILLFCVLPYQLDAQTPDFNFAVCMGAANQDNTTDVVVDNTGNSYVVGYFQNTVDFNPSGMTNNLFSAGSADIFIAKYDPDGNYIWAFSMGASGFDAGSAITLDATGNIYVCGSFAQSVDFDPGIGSAILSSSSFGDGFIAKYDTDGNYIWAIELQGAGNSTITDLVLDSGGNICVGGRFSTTVDFNPSLSTANLTATVGVQDLFIAKYTAAGVYTWAYKLSGTGSKTLTSIGTDSGNNIYIGGYITETVDFNPGAGTANLTGGMTSADIFMAKYNSSGTYLWANSIGNPAVANYETVEDMKVAEDGTIFVTGQVGGSVVIDFDPSAGVANISGPPGNSTYVAKYNAAGAYQWAHGLGTPGGSSQASGIAYDNAGNIYITGQFTGTVDFDPSGSSTTLTPVGNNDVYFAKYTTDGLFSWAEKFGGTMYDYSSRIALDNAGSLWICGMYSTTVDFDIDPVDDSSFTSNGAEDAYVVRYDYCSATTASETSHTDVSCNGGNDGEIILNASGSSPFTYDWNPGSGNTLSGIGADTYICVVTSACGNTDTISVTVTEPAVIVPSVVSQTNVVCNGENTGAVTASATGGTGVLTFEWQPGSLTTETINNLSAGNYICTVTDQNGCEEDMLVSVTEPAAITFTQNINLCYGEEISVGTNTYSSNGTYQDVLTALNGCDSTVTTNLTIHPEINNAVNQSDITLTAVQTAADYQWIDCNNGNAPLTGETDQSFTAATNGSYAVVITQGSCSDTSACMLLTDVSVAEYTPTTLVLYPNPASDVLFITCQVEIIRAELIDMQGKTIQTIIGPAPQIYLQQVATGTYYIRMVTENNEVLTRKITKQNL